MEKRKSVRSFLALSIFGGGLAILIFGIAGLPFFGGVHARDQLIPWRNIGGCGAGGSGGSEGGGMVKWIGRGVSGGLLDLQTMSSVTFGQTFGYQMFNSRFSIKPTWKTDVGLAVPLALKSGQVQYRSNQADLTRTSGGLGDLSVDAAYSFGSIAQYSLTLALGLPTGQYDIQRGPDAGKTYLPTSLQLGRGVYSPSIMFSYTKDMDNGMILADFSYSHPMALRLLSGKNEFLTKYGFADFASASDKRFFYRFKPYGENDLGDYFPPSLNLALYYAYRAQEKRVQSIGFNFNAPLGVAWIHSETVGRYDPRPDPDFKPWALALQYGYEFSNETFPVYFVVQLPLYGTKHTVTPDNEYKETAVRGWNTPDWGNFLQTGTIYLGFKSTFF